MIFSMHTVPNIMFIISNKTKFLKYYLRNCKVKEQLEGNEFV